MIISVSHIQNYVTVVFLNSDHAKMRWQTTPCFFLLMRLGLFRVTASQELGHQCTHLYHEHLEKGVVRGLFASDKQQIVQLLFNSPQKHVQN